MDAEVEFLSIATKRRLDCDSSWATTEIRGHFEYKNETKFLVYHRYFGDVVVSFQLKKRQIWTFIGTSEIPYVDDLTIGSNILENKYRLRDFVLRYVTKVIKTRASKL